MLNQAIDQLLVLSQDKLKDLDTFLDLTRDQGQAIREGDYGQLEKILGEKFQLMERIDQLDLEFYQGFQSLKEEGGVEDISQLDLEDEFNLRELKKTVEKIQLRLGETARLDRKNTQLLEEGLGNIKGELKQVKDGRLAYKAYNHTQVDSILIDERK